MNRSLAAALLTATFVAPGAAVAAADGGPIPPAFVAPGAAVAATDGGPIPAARVATLDWMAGTWSHHAEGRETVTESWIGPRNGVMVAANLTTGPNGRRSFEFLRIADTADGCSYFASPGGRAPVEFRLKESGDRRVVFENAAHDFPQRILYWRDGDELVARIEGTLKGKERSEEWRFSRISAARGRK